MSSRSIIQTLCCLVLLASAPSAIFAAEESPLHKSMEAIGDAFKPLYRNMKDGPDSDRIEQYLEWTRTIKTEAVKAREHAPDMAKKMSGEESDTLVKDYTADMDTFIQNVEALEKALLAGNLTEAQTLVQKLKGDRRDGHGKYQEEED